MTPRLWSIGWPWNRTAWCNMAKSRLTERWRLCYTMSNDDGDTLLDLDIQFENVDDAILAQRIQTFLKAAGRYDMAEIKEAK